MLSSNLWCNPQCSSDKPFDLIIGRVDEDRDVKVDHDKAQSTSCTRDKKVVRLKIEMRHPICMYEGDRPCELAHEIEGDRGRCETMRVKG